MIDRGWPGARSRTDGHDNLEPPCRRACPADKDIPGFLRAIARGDTPSAWRIAIRDNLFPGVLGWICPRPCESSCRLGAGSTPVPICALTRWVTEREGSSVASLAAARPDGPRIAVLGAGPAGLAAAHDLTVSGARVRLFDRGPEPGGLLVSCIPDFRLPASVVRDDVDRILSMGIPFEGNRSFTDIHDVTKLLSEGYAAVLLAVGAGGDRLPRIRGWRTSPETTTAIDFLASFRKGGLRLPNGRAIVIGAGNAALDAARAALRAGAKEVGILYRRDWSDMPALPSEIEEAKEEGVQFHTLTLPIETVWEEGRLSGLRTIDTRINGLDLVGRREVIPVEGTERFYPADMVIAAIGQEHPLQQWLDMKESSGDGRIAAMPAPGVFACGDFVAGPSTVVEAIASGRRAAAAIRDHLAREGTWRVLGDEFDEVLNDSLPRPARPSTRERATAELSMDSASAMAGSCLRCDYSLRLRDDRCILCGECAVRCAQDSLRWSRNGSGAYRLSVNDSTCTRCGDCVNACPVGAIHWSLWTSRNRNTDPQTPIRV